MKTKIKGGDMTQENNGKIQDNGSKEKYSIIEAINDSTGDLKHYKKFVKMCRKKFKKALKINNKNLLILSDDELKGAHYFVKERDNIFIVRYLRTNYMDIVDDFTAVVIKEKVNIPLSEYPQIMQEVFDWTFANKKSFPQHLSRNEKGVEK